MSGTRLDDSLWLLTRTTGPSRAARIVILVAPIVATVCTTLGAGQPFLIGSSIMVALAAVCAVVPDTHLGLILILALAGEWALRVEDPLSPWSIGLAAMIGLFHTSLAFASIAPGGAHLSPSITRVWIRRALLLTGPPIGVWAAVVTLDQVDLGHQPVLVAAALIALALLGFWLGSPPRPRPEDA